MIKKYPITVIILFFALILFCLYAFMFISTGYIDEDRNKFKEIRGSVFYTTEDDKVYAMVPSGGRFELIGTKASKFKYLDTGKYDNRNVGMSDEAVYCGNLVMSGLDPKSVRALGNGYFSDGKMTYFCNSASVPNLEIRGVVEAWQMISHALLNIPKAQSHIYKFRQVDNLNLSPILGFGYASDGVKVYHEGKELEGANASKLRYIEETSGRKSAYYTTDGENVYYKDSKLAIKFTPQMRHIGSAWHVHYLYEPSSGMVYANDHGFDPKFAPYTPIFGLEDTQSYHILFRGKGGIFHWERKWKWYDDDNDGKFVRDGDDPFKGEVTRLFGKVLVSGGETFFIRTYEIWNNTRHDHSLKSRNTGIFKLSTQDEWRKIGLVRNGVYGTVYANGDKTYYFDEIGSGWSLKSSIYEINDLGIVEILTRPYDPNAKNLTTKEVADMVRSGAMVPAEGELVVEAVSEFNNSYKNLWFWIFLVVLGFAFSVWGSYKKAKERV